MTIALVTPMLEARVLKILFERGCVTAGKLAALLGKRKRTMQQLLDRFVELGLARKVKAPLFYGGRKGLHCCWVYAYTPAEGFWPELSPEARYAAEHAAEIPWYIQRGRFQLWGCGSKPLWPALHEAWEPFRRYRESMRGAAEKPA